MICLEIDQDLDNIIAALQYDNDLSWPKIESLWRKTINFKLHTTKENSTASIFKKWMYYRY